MLSTKADHTPPTPSVSFNCGRTRCEDETTPDSTLSPVSSARHVDACECYNAVSSLGIARSADLYVNGVEQLSNYTGFLNSEERVFWGSGSSADTGQANFNRVAFSIVPEPSMTGGLILITVALVILRRKRGWTTPFNRKASGATSCSLCSAN